MKLLSFKLSVIITVCLHQYCMLSASPTAQSPNTTPRKWTDVLGSGSCKPRETVVRIGDEYPSLISQRFSPPCVSVMRCGGCCNDESLECVPTEEANITMEVMSVSVSSTGSNPGMQNMQFVEHLRCDCKPKTTPTPEPQGQPRR
uniref:VEGF n=1 Tax=Pseudocowpox virus TaxID=129726 RepID=B6VAE7_9POXV|nr:VEGF [Pseudocowpox virus]